VTHLARVSPERAVRALAWLADSSTADALLVAELCGEGALLGAFQAAGRSGLPGEIRGPCGGRSARLGEGIVLAAAVVEELAGWLPGDDVAQLSGARVLNRLARGVLAGLTQIGVAASYPGRDFVSVAGRRVVQLSLGRGAAGALVFQGVCGNARAFATEEPAPEFPGLPPLPEAAPLGADPARLAAALAEGFARRFGLSPEPAELSAGELRALDAVELAAVDEPELAELHSGGPVATPIGRLEAHVRLRSDGALERVRLRGDWIASRPAVRALEEALAGRRPEAADTLELCARWLAAPTNLAVGVPDARLVALALHKSASAAA